MRLTGRISIALACCALAACAKPALTDVVRQQYGLTAEDVRKMQLFTSEQIVLRREVGGQEKVSEKSGLALVDGTRIEEVVIPRHTPCVALRVEGDYILAGFSPSHPERALWFGIKQSAADAPSGGRRFELVQLENDPFEPPPFQPRFSKTFLVTYAGRKYHLADAAMWNAHLVYDLDESSKREKLQEEPPGWRISDRPPPPIPQSKPTPPPAPSASAAPTPATPDSADAGNR